MPLTPLIHALWISGLVLSVAVASVVLVRRHYRDMPAFATYTCFSATFGVWMWVIQKHYTVYFYSYWSSEFVFLALDVWIIIAVYLQLARAYAPAKGAAARVLYSTTALFAVISVASLVVKQNKTSVHWLVETFEIILRSAKIVQLGALVALFLIAHFLSIRMRRQDRIVALGLAIITASNVVGLALLREFGFNHTEFINVVMMLGINAGMLLWAFGLWTVGLESGGSQLALPDVPVEDWNQTLSEMLDE